MNRTSKEPTYAKGWEVGILLVLIWVTLIVAGAMIGHLRDRIEALEAHVGITSAESVEEAKR